jgi:CarD family transcriptional regulator
MEEDLAMFQLGEKVIYPQYGLGTISEVTEKSVNGTRHAFYRLEFSVKQMEILVPVQRARENGLRRVMDEDSVNDLIRFICSSHFVPKPQQWHRWRKKTLEQMKTGDPMDIANIYCYLRTLEGKKGLSFTERKILMQVERMLISEVAVAKQISEEEAEALLRPPPKARPKAS